MSYDAGSQTWDWTAAGQFVDLGGIATLGSANLTAQGDPRRLSLGFALTAGANDTTVTITSFIRTEGATINDEIRIRSVNSSTTWSMVIAEFRIGYESMFQWRTGAGLHNTQCPATR